MKSSNRKKYEVAFHLLLGSFIGLSLALVLFGLNMSRAESFSGKFLSWLSPIEAPAVEDQEVQLAEESQEPAIQKSVFTHILLQDGTIVEK